MRTPAYWAVADLVSATSSADTLIDKLMATPIINTAGDLKGRSSGWRKLEEFVQ